MADVFKPQVFGLRVDTMAPYAGYHRVTSLVNYRPERHCHDYWELYIHLHGGQFYGVEDKIKELEPNMLVINPPFCMHGMIHDRNLLNYERLYVCITTQTLEEIGGETINLVKLFQKSTSSGNYFFSMTKDDVSMCKELVLHMNQAFNSDNPLSGLDAYVALVRYLQIICHTIKDVAPSDMTQRSYPLMQQVMVYLDQHYSEQLSLQQVAQTFNISVSHLSHEFARYSKRSVYDYILYRRVMMACVFLRKGMNMTSTAYQCGFNNYNTFARAFKKIIGMMPSEYQRDKRNVIIHR